MAKKLVRSAPPDLPLAPPDASSDDLTPQHIVVQGKDEMNLSEFPFALLRRQADSRQVFTYEGFVIDKDGNKKRQTWTVRGAMGLGLPNEYDERVMVALMAISAMRGFQSRKVPFSVYQVLKIMGLGDSKRDYNNIERSLERISGALVKADGSFWDHAEKAFSTHKAGFHLIETYWLSYLEEDETIREREGVPAYFIWGEVLWKSIQDGYIKQLDLDVYYSLGTPLSRKLYRFLDKRLYKNPYFEIDVFELGGRLGLAAYKYPSQVLDKLQPGIEELIRIHFLAEAGSKKHGKYTRVWFRKARADVLLDSATEIHPDTAGTAEPLAAVVLDMMEFGLHEEVARELAAAYEEEYIQRKIDYLRVQLKRKRQSIRNPGGWLRKAIEEDFTPPGAQGTQLVFDTPPPRVADAAGGADTGSVVIEDPDSGFLRTTWQAVLTEIQGRTTRATYERLFPKTRLFALDGRSATILVPDAQAAEVLEHRLSPTITESITRVLGRTVSISFLVEVL